MYDGTDEVFRRFFLRLVQKVVRKTKNFFLKTTNRKAFETEFLETLPKKFHPPACLLFQKDFTAEEREIGQMIEKFRSEVVSQKGNVDAYAYGSPRPETFKTDQGGRAEPGPIRKGDIKKFMKTGATIENGLLLRRIVKGLGSKRVLELGTNAGFSGCYFLAADNVTELVTIEGSTVLADIAKQNLSRISENFKVMVTLFDDALAELQANNEKFDCVFIDGQHEKDALLHYIENVIPLLHDDGAIIIDDLYWSEDMNMAWQQVHKDKRFIEVVNLSSKGICVYSSQSKEPAYYNICDYMGEPLFQYEDRYDLKYS